MDWDEMKEIAHLIRIAVDKKGCKKVRKKVQEFRKEFKKIHYWR